MAPLRVIKKLMMVFHRKKRIISAQWTVAKSLMQVATH